VGRLPEYSAKVAAEICKAISEGQTLRATCRKLQVDHSTVLQWVRDDREGFANRYAHARELQVEAWADLIVCEAEDSSKDTVTLTRRDGTEYEAPDHEWINRSRLRVDTYKWLMSKLLPKKYGDKVTQQLEGPDGGPVQLTWKSRSTTPPGTK
jgi:hypothetical protein